MTDEVFQKYYQEIMERVQANLVSKANRDYAIESDKLYNFHSAAPILGSPTKVCLAYSTKHFMSIAKLVNEGKLVPQDLALEKVGDLITYMTIMYALMREREIDEVPTEAPRF